MMEVLFYNKALLIVACPRVRTSYPQVFGVVYIDVRCSLVVMTELVVVIDLPTKQSRRAGSVTCYDALVAVVVLEAA